MRGISKFYFLVDTKIPLMVEAVTQYGFLILMQVLPNNYYKSLFFHISIYCLKLCIFQMLVGCFYDPYFTIPCAVIFVCVFLMDYTMSNGVRETKRLDNEKKAPVIHHITSSMAGIVTIRGFQREKIFMQRLASKNFDTYT